MSKYIDADRLCKEIDHRIDILAGVSIKCAKNDDTKMHAYYHGKAVSLQELLSFIDSLQQERQPSDLDADIEMEWNSFNKHLVEYEEGSEEVIWLNWISFIDIACYFYELGLKEK